jgi:hypothetical protein
MATAVFVASGFTTSSAFAIHRPRFALHVVNSTPPSQVRVAFAQSLDANSGGFAVLMGDGTGAPYVVLSGGLSVVSQPIPAVTPYVRIALSAATTGPFSFTAIPLTS